MCPSPPFLPKQTVAANNGPDSAINSTLHVTTLSSAKYALSSTDQQRLTALPFPTKVWQSWKDDSEDPTERSAGYPQQWRAVNPGFRYERITDSNGETYVRDRFSPDVSKLFSDLSDPILRADLLRYLILYADGGVWSDIDTRPAQAVSKWIPEEYANRTNLVVGIETDHHGDLIRPDLPNTVLLAQYAVLAKPRHVTMARLIERVCEMLREKLDAKDWRNSTHESDPKNQSRGLRERKSAPQLQLSFDEVISTTGPFSFTSVLMEYFSEQTGEEYTGHQLTALREPKLIGDVLVLPVDSFGWMPQLHTVEENDALVKVTHLFIGSWRASHPG